MATWNCCLLGRRENYAIPRALAAVGEDVRLFTEAWCPPGLPWSVLRASAGFRARYHPALAEVPVKSATANYLGREFLEALEGSSGWGRIMRRNEWFSAAAARSLEEWIPNAQSDVAVFVYSYTALDVFRLARKLGWKTVLGQIDAGPRLESIVRDAAQEFPWLGNAPPIAPSGYWDAWREECELADRIVVNSSWTRQCMLDLGIPEQKLAVIPLVVDLPKGARVQRTFPREFTPQRPLRVLFAGQVALGKGIGALLGAAKALQGVPIEFSIVGPLRVEVPEAYRQMASIRWIGEVPHERIGTYYDAADVLLFPTLCDGFGLVQIEAQAHALPVIASRYCGEVVVDGENGLLLGSVDASQIAGALRRILAHPPDLERFSLNSMAARFGLADLGHAIRAMF